NSCGHRRGPALGDRQVTVTLSRRAASAPNRLARKDFGSASAGIVTSLIGGVGVWAGALGMVGPVRAVQIGWLLPLSGVQLSLDPLGGFFMALIGAVAIAVGIYVIGYSSRGP